MIDNNQSVETQNNKEFKILQAAKWYSPEVGGIETVALAITAAVKNKAEMKMSEKQIKRLPVCDNNNHVIGILTLGDLCHNGSKIGEHEIAKTIENICDCKTNQ